MPEACAKCGASCEKNAAGHYREHCPSCITELADADPPDTPVHKRESYIEWLHSDRRE